LSSDKHLHINRAHMLQISTEILTFLGTPINGASSISDSLVQAQASGHASHGIIRLIEYSENVENGLIRPASVAHVISEEKASIVIDAEWGWGHLASKFAVDIATEKAREFGTCIITIRNCNHIGRLGEYVETLANHELISLMWCNAEPSVAAYGGRERLLGTNPFAAGIPSSRKPIVIDFATAAIAEGKLRVARSKQEMIKPGAILDKDGNSSIDPEDFYEGGVLLPFGEHKGYCLSLMIDLLGGALSGNHPAINSKYKAGNGTVLLVIDPKRLLPYNAFIADIDEATQHVRNSQPIDPKSPIQIPGDVENFHKTVNENVIEIDQGIWSTVMDLHQRLDSARK
jgi:LDH2 family malate/lactate/ureidoglycolate dehydrogenase